MTLHAPSAHGQVSYYTQSATLPEGKYTTSGSKVHVVGGTVFEDGKITPSGQQIILEVAPFSEFEGVQITLTNARLLAKNVTFRDCVITAAEGGHIDFNGCILQGVSVMQNPLRATMQANGGLVPITEQQPSLVSLRECLLKGVMMGYNQPSPSSAFPQPGMPFQPGIPQPGIPQPGVPRPAIPQPGNTRPTTLPPGPPQSVLSRPTTIGATFQLEQCSIHGRDFRLPTFAINSSYQERLRLCQILVKGCRFVDCDLTASTVLISKDCIFEECGLVGKDDVKIPGITTVSVAATFLPKEKAYLTTRRLPQVQFTPISPSAPIGSSLTYTVTEKGLQLTGTPTSTATMQPVNLTIVLPAAKLEPAQPAPGTPAPGAPTPPTEETVAMSFGDVTGTEGSPDSGLKVKQTSVHGLLIMSLASGDAGSASKMSAIALPTDPTSNSMVRFNQPVGEMMTKALAEVAKFTQLSHNGWPKGHTIELSFADKYSNKDGPSAAVACALLLHSLITGQELDPVFAVTGDMNADGSVQPIGGVAAKIRGATKGHCKLIGIPSKNESALSDVLLIDGPAPFASIQIFSIEKFSDAEVLAVAVKPENTTTSILEMNRVQEVLMRNPAQMGAWLKNQHVIAKLQQVLKDTPNHLSAKYLLMYASGRVPQTLSLVGSLTAIDNTAGDLIGAIKANKGDAFDSMGKSSIGSTLTRLQGLRARCDVRARPYADAIIDFGATVKEALDRPAQTSARQDEYRNKIRGAASSVESQLSRLLNDPVVREELEG